jgi:hypothetical protein
MPLFTKIAETFPLLLLSAGVIALFNGLLQMIVTLASADESVSFDLALPEIGLIVIDPARLWPWLLGSGAVLFMAGMTTRR